MCLISAKALKNSLVVETVCCLDLHSEDLVATLLKGSFFEYLDYLLYIPADL